MSLSTNVLVMTRGGLLIGRQMRSPAPVQMARPSESWISGRQSADLAAARLAIPVHAGERRDPEPGDRLAREQLRRDLHVDVMHAVRLSLVALRRHAIGAGNARTVEQRIKNKRRVVRRSGLEPEFGEAREFLRRREARVDGEAAGGEAILIERPGGAEIGGAHEREPVGLEIRRHDAEAREPDIVGQLPRRVIGRDIEQIGAVEHLSRLAAADDIDVHGVARVAAEVKQLHRQALLLVEHQCSYRAGSGSPGRRRNRCAREFRARASARRATRSWRVAWPAPAESRTRTGGALRAVRLLERLRRAWRWRPRHGLAWRAASRARKRRRQRAFGAD